MCKYFWLNLKISDLPVITFRSLWSTWLVTYQGALSVLFLSNLSSFSRFGANISYCFGFDRYSTVIALTQTTSQWDIMKKRCTWLFQVVSAGELGRTDELSQLPTLAVLILRLCLVFPPTLDRRCWTLK